MFRHLTLPYLFERTVFDGDRFWKNTDVGRRAWVHAISDGKRPAIDAASYVKHVVFHCDPKRASESEAILAQLVTARPFAELYCGVLDRMDNLGDAEFVRCRIFTNHIVALRQLSKLRKVAFRECTWEDGILETVVPGLGSKVEDVELKPRPRQLGNELDLGVSDWGYKVLIATTSLRRIVAARTTTLRMIGSKGQIKLGHIREICVHFCPFPEHSDTERQWRYEMFHEAKNWLPYYPAIERLVLFSSWPGARGIKPLDRPRKLVQTITDMATAKFHCLRRLEILDPYFETTQIMFKRNLTEDVLQAMVHKVCPKLEYLRFGPLEWTLQSGGWVQNLRVPMDGRKGAFW